MSYSKINDGIHDTIFNATLEAFVKIEKILAAVVIRVPGDSNDKNFQREIYRTTIDFQKFFEEVQGSFITRVVKENLMKSIGFDLKFPFEKVNFHKLLVRILMYYCFIFFFFLRESID